MGAVEDFALMRLEFQCWKCPEGTPGRRVTRPFNEDGAYQFECASGHVHEIVLSQMRFEVLAETAMQALVDGYYRDAVSSFAAALERVFEFYVKVVSLATGLDGSIYLQTWKLVAKQSERQLGMYLALYQLENKAVPPMLAQHHVSFRNRVIHEGYFPTVDEAVSFGQAVVGLVQPLLNAMMPKYTFAIEAMMIHHTSNAKTTTLGGFHHVVFFDNFVLKFDTEADDWEPPTADIAEELSKRSLEKYHRDLKVD